jgi:hypothetical protein
MKMLPNGFIHIRIPFSGLQLPDPKVGENKVGRARVNDYRTSFKQCMSLYFCFSLFSLLEYSCKFVTLLSSLHQTHHHRHSVLLRMMMY